MVDEGRADRFHRSLFLVGVDALLRVIFSPRGRELLLENDPDILKATTTGKEGYVGRMGLQP